ncbi:TetR/AcrR family transcriptional regulator [Clostridium sporogenes]|uniref:TetR/AcrR family transcriptional regulator n=1 Tax=Clostridium sporogenes TaxID=1509 RepID=UPI0029033317|nr:TetR/AcrR family transcriptional regulator [Clostridium botulinum]
MGTAFTDNERNIIKTKLKACASICMNKYGIKKTTVDELVKEVGISKGAFYKFYDSKELLFFEVFQDYHSEIYGAALNILITHTDLSERERIEEALLKACKLMKESSIMYIVENELQYLLRKIPPEVLEDHFHSDDVHIQELIRESGITINKSPEFVCAVVKAIMLTLSHQKNIGEEYYDDVLKLLVKGACQQLLEG